MEIWDWFRRHRPSSEEVERALREFREGDYDRRKESGRVLVAAGRRAVAPLIGMLKVEDADLPWEIGDVLKGIGRPALQALLEFIQAHEGADLRRGLRALWELEETAAPAIPRLAGLLKSADPEVRMKSAHALGRIGPACAAVLPDLLGSTLDPDAGVRSSAAYALERSGVAREEVRTALTRLLGDPESGVRGDALGAFEALYPRDLPPIEVFRRLLRDDDTDVRRKAIERTGERGARASEVAADLAESLDHPELELAAAEAVWLVTGRAERVMPVVLRNLRKAEGCNPETACDVVSKVGPAARDAVPRLVELLKEEDYDLLWAAADALAAIGRDAEPAIPALARLLEHESGTVGSSAAHALGEIGRPAFPAVFHVLKTGAPRAQEFAADALGRLGEAALEALPSLVRLLDRSRDEPEFFCWILLAIGEIDPEEAGAERLASLLDEGLASSMRARAAAALGRLGPDAAPALSALKKAARDGDEKIAQAARTALDRIRKS